MSEQLKKSDIQSLVSLGLGNYVMDAKKHLDATARSIMIVVNRAKKNYDDPTVLTIANTLQTLVDDLDGSIMKMLSAIEDAAMTTDTERRGQASSKREMIHERYGALMGIFVSFNRTFTRTPMMNSDSFYSLILSMSSMLKVIGVTSPEYDSGVFTSLYCIGSLPIMIRSQHNVDYQYKEPDTMYSIRILFPSHTPSLHDRDVMTIINSFMDNLLIRIDPYIDHPPADELRVTPALSPVRGPYIQLDARKIESKVDMKDYISTMNAIYSALSCTVTEQPPKLRQSDM